MLLWASVPIEAQEWAQVDKVLPQKDINLFDRFGNSMAMFNDYLVIGAPESDIQEVNSGAVYVLRRSGNSWTKVATLLPSDPEENLYFGRSVSIFERTIVIGAPGTLQGRAYIFYRTGEEWSDTQERQRIMPMESADSDQFGAAVVTFEDQVLVGASRADGLTPNSGVVYVFQGTSNWETVSQNARLTASDPTSLNGLINEFGSALAYDGQVLVVGAHLADPTAYDDGAAYIFEKPVSGWVDNHETAKIFQTNGANNSGFGHSVAILDDLIVVGGKRMEDEDPIAAVVFKKGVGGWQSTSEIAKLKASLSGDFPFYWGSQVAIEYNQIVVSAPGVEQGLYGANLILVYEQPDGDWTDQLQDAIMITDEAVKGRELGRSLILEESTIYAGVPDDNEIGMTSGSIVTFQRSGTSWTNDTQVQRIASVESNATRDDFGRYVDLYENIAVVGAPGDDQVGRSSGAAYVLQRQGVTWSVIAKLTASDSRSADGFGNGVAIHKDEIIVGAPFADSLDDKDQVIHYNSGAAYIFTKPVAGWENATETKKLSLSSPKAEQKFGIAVDIEDGVAIVGAYNNSDSESLGSAHIFRAPNSNWDDADQIALLTTLSNEKGDGFGNAVCIKEDLIVVGAARTRFPEIGKAYLFEKDDADWSDMTETAILSRATEERGLFGLAVDIFQNTIVVGDQTANVAGVETGAAFIYERPVGGWVDATETAILVASDGEDMDYFGSDVVISQDYAVVTAGGKDQATGAAYYFQRAERGWESGSEDFKLPVSEISSGSQFGISVASDEDRIMVGANRDSNETGSEAGAVFIFEKERVLSTDDPQFERSIEYYPNPVGNTLKLEVSNDQLVKGNLMVKIMEISGKLIDQRILSTPGIATIDFSGLTQGVYLVQIQSGKSKVIYKILKGLPD